MGTERLRESVQAFTQAIDAGYDEARILAEGRQILGRLIAHDDWLPDFAAAPDPVYYRQYLLHCDPLQRFSIVSFVWGPGQMTPVHDHTVWGLVGVLRGEEKARRFVRQADGRLVAGDWETMRPGDIGVVSPQEGDIHQVANALADRPSISIHVYGANIGATERHVFDTETGAPTPFVSGYSNAALPNIWSR